METNDAGREAPFKDRRAGLIVFGALSIVIGALCGCLMVFTAFLTQLAGSLTPEQDVPSPDPRGLAMGLLVYLALSVLFIWAGIGSIQARKWVRPLMVILGWTWLLCGVFALAIWLVMLPDFPAAMQAARPNDPPLSSAMYRVVSLTASTFLLVLYIALPAAFVWFYQDRNVKATLERLDTRARWTDRCPLPVLGLSLGLAAGAFGSLGALLYDVFVAFGIVLTGIPAAAAILATAAVFAYLARATYRLEMAGWWGTVILTCVMTVSGIVTFFRIEPLELYARMGVPAEQIEMLRHYSFLRGPAAGLVVAVMALATLGYMVYVRKYFAGPK